MCLRGLSRSHARRKVIRNDKKQENDEDSNNGNKRLTGTNADVVDAHASSSEYTGAFRSIHVDLYTCRVSLHV